MMKPIFYFFYSTLDYMILSKAYNKYSDLFISFMIQDHFHCLTKSYLNEPKVIQLINMLSIVKGIGGKK